MVTAAEQPEPTAAERAALAFLVGLGRDRDAVYRGGDFVPYYAARAQREAGEHRDFAGTDRRHAWRRTGGVVLARMERKGFVIGRGSDWGTQLYALTARGREIGEAAK